MNTKLPHSLENVFPGRPNGIKTQKSVAGVRQDKGATKPARIASPQPAPQQNGMRPHALNSNTARSQTRPTPKRKLIHLTIWVKPGVKAELQRKAGQGNLSVSAVASALLEHALAYDLDMTHSAVMKPIIQKAIREEMRAYSTRLAVLLVRALFASEQTRSLVTNILSRQQGVTQPLLEQILNGSSTAAKRKITHMTPQLEQLVADVAAWMEQEEGDTPHA